MLLFAILGVIFAIGCGVIYACAMTPKEFFIECSHEHKVKKYVRLSKKWKKFNLSSNATKFLLKYFQEFSEYNYTKEYFETKGVYKLNDSMEKEHFIYLFERIRTCCGEDANDFFQGLYKTHFGYSYPTSTFKILNYNLLDVSDAKEEYAQKQNTLI